MSSLNQVVLMGRLGKDPEVKNAGGISIAKFSLATSKQWKDESGEKAEKVNWTEIVCFRKTADLAGLYLKKGKQVLVVGELQTRSYEKDGQKRYVTEVIANNLQFIGPSESGAKVAEAIGASPDLSNDEIPF